MSRHHIIISGTGRAGTTFLVQLFTELGLDTGFPNAHAQIYTDANAGMEYDIRNPMNAPYIVKSPGLCDYLDEALQSDDIVIDHALIPIRDLYSAAQSRREIASKADPSLDIVPGGLWPTKHPDGQEAQNQEWILAGKLYNLLFTLAKHNIPLVLLLFPKFINDPEYLYQKIGFMLSGISYDTFLRAFQVISKPGLVHNFTEKNNSSMSREKAVTQTRPSIEKEQVEQELRTQLFQKQQALDEILNSKAWKLMITLRKLRTWFSVPRHTSKS